MGAFWNPNAGIMINGRSLSKKEIALLTRKWSEHSSFSTSFCSGGGTRLRWLYHFFSAKPARFHWQKIKTKDRVSTDGRKQGLTCGRLPAMATEKTLDAKRIKIVYFR